jgi:cytochrome c nitrite reductase small subunit
MFAKTSQLPLGSHKGNGMRPRFWKLSMIAPLAFCAALGLTIGLGSYTFWYAEGGSYLSNDPKTCVNCHIMRDQYDGWQHASHHAVATCNDCHVPHETIAKYLAKAEHGFFHSKAFTLQDFDEPIRIHAKSSRSLQENCVHCHQELVSEIRGHMKDGDESNNCVRCHAAVGHGPPR